MSTAKHTPGPWHINRNSEWICDIVTHHGELPDGSKSCWNIASISIRREEHQANAHLIAAAPDLLYVLKELLDMCQRQEDFNDDSDGCMFDRASAAISKAEGVL